MTASELDAVIRDHPWAEKDRRFLVRFALYCATETVLSDGRKIADLLDDKGRRCVSLVQDWLARKPVTVEQLRSAAYAAYAANAANAAAYAAASAAYATYTAADAACDAAADAAAANAAASAAYAANAAANAACAACAADAARRQQLEWLLDNAPKRFKARLATLMLGVAQ